MRNLIQTLKEAHEVLKDFMSRPWDEQTLNPQDLVRVNRAIIELAKQIHHNDVKAILNDMEFGPYEFTADALLKYGNKISEASVNHNIPLIDISGFSEKHSFFQEMCDKIMELEPA